MSTDTTSGKDESKNDDLGKVKEVLDTPVFSYGEGVYKESDDHVPDPLFQTGYMDTSGTAGKANDSIESTSPIFEVARVQNMRNAVRALDPEDESVPSEMVVLPQGSVTVQGTAKTAEEGRREVFSAVLKAAENPPTIGGPNAAQREAALEDKSISTEEKPGESTQEPTSKTEGDDKKDAGTGSTTSTKPSTTQTTTTKKTEGK